MEVSTVKTCVLSSECDWVFRQSHLNNEQLISGPNMVCCCMLFHVWHYVSRLQWKNIHCYDMTLICRALKHLHSMGMTVHAFFQVCSQNVWSNVQIVCNTFDTSVVPSRSYWCTHGKLGPAVFSFCCAHTYKTDWLLCYLPMTWVMYVEGLLSLLY